MNNTMPNKDQDRTPLINEARSYARIIPRKSENNQEESETKDEKENQASSLVKLASDVTLFFSQEHGSFATIPVKNHKENWKINSNAFRGWLKYRFFTATKKVPSTQALQDAISLLEAKAEFEGEKAPVFIRIAEHGGAIYIDLANEKWEVVKITHEGWAIISNPPVKFRRVATTYSLPTPVHGGTIEELKNHINVKTDRDFKLLVGFLLAALKPDIPYLILVIHGDHGSAKSTAEAMLKKLIDPNKGMIRAEPKEVRDLVIAANNSHLIAYDNLSHIKQWLSDALCRIATGGGLGTRTLYKDEDETIFEARKPVILNGIKEIVVMPDLLDRCVIIYLPEIMQDARKTTEDVWKKFEEAQPRIMGALFDTVSGAIKALPGITLPLLPRMADAVRWVTAAEASLGWKPQSFIQAYEEHRLELNDLALEASAIYSALLEFIDIQKEWIGTAQELLIALNQLVSVTIDKPLGWAKTPRGLSGQLRSITPNLRQVGIEVQFGLKSSDKKSQRLISIRYDESTLSDGSDDEKDLLSVDDIESILGGTVN